MESPTMTLVESLLLAIIHGFSRFVPVNGEAHEAILSRFLGFPSASPEWIATFALGALLALLLYFIHDWASILSSFIQVVLYRKRPMTLDERLPFFLLLCMGIPFAVLFSLLRRLHLDSLLGLQLEIQAWLPWSLAGGTLILFLASRWSKRTQGLFNLGMLDSVLFGAGQALSWIPGMGGTLPCTLPPLRPGLQVAVPGRRARGRIPPARRLMSPAKRRVGKTRSPRSVPPCTLGPSSPSPRSPP